MKIHNLDKYRVEAYHIKYDDYKAEFYFEDNLILEEYYFRKHNMEDKLGKMGVEFINYHSTNGSVTKKQVRKIENAYEDCYKYYKVKENKE